MVSEKVDGQDADDMLEGLFEVLIVLYQQCQESAPEQTINKNVRPTEMYMLANPETKLWEISEEFKYNAIRSISLNNGLVNTFRRLGYELNDKAPGNLFGKINDNATSERNILRCFAFSILEVLPGVCQEHNVHLVTSRAQDPILPFVFTGKVI